jgi:mono/diheme cytochrome c family protein
MRGKSSRFALAAGLAGAAIAAVFAIAPAGAQAPDGAQIFATAGCSACHGANGEGGVGPAFANNADLADAAAVLRQIIRGGGIMPPFGTLTDDQIAAVANHIRNSFGNTNATMITAADVVTARAAP